MQVCRYVKTIALGVTAPRSLSNTSINQYQAMSFRTICPSARSALLHNLRASQAERVSFQLRASLFEEFNIDTVNTNMNIIIDVDDKTNDFLHP